MVFGVAIEKAWRPNEDHYERAFEDLVSRFDLFVRRYNATANQGEHRGIIAVAESTYRQNLEVLGERFRGGSTRRGAVRTLAEVPFFFLLETRAFSNWPISVQTLYMADSTVV